MSEELYLANYDEGFRNLIKGLLKLGKLQDKYIDIITDNNGMKTFIEAFTHPTVNKNYNYELLETLGDSTINKCIVWYVIKRFPQLNCPFGNKIVARLKINLVSKKSFSLLGKQLDFWKYVSCDLETRQTKMEPTLEDVFEAFFGATETVIDNRIREGVGYTICYNIIKSLFDNIDISLKYEDLFDAKTRLKQIFDSRSFKEQGIGTLLYESEKNEETKLVSTNVFRVFGNRKVIIGQGVSSLKPKSEQIAAAIAIDNLKRIGFELPVPEEYTNFCL
jgi:dsRNA-specific ribonuclease